MLSRLAPRCPHAVDPTTVISDRVKRLARGSTPYVWSNPESAADQRFRSAF